MYGDVEARQTLELGKRGGRVGRQRRTMFSQIQWQEGWLSIDDLVPLYLFSDDKVREQYQARFDPHRKINI